VINYLMILFNGLKKTTLFKGGFYNVNINFEYEKYKIRRRILLGTITSNI